MRGEKDETPADLLIDLRRQGPLRGRRSQYQCLQIRKKMPQCTLLGKPPNDEKRRRWWYPSKGRKLYFKLAESVLDVNDHCVVFVLFMTHTVSPSEAFTSSVSQNVHDLPDFQGKYGNFQCVL